MQALQKPDIFAHAIAQLEDSGQPCSSPRAFQEYLRECGQIKAARTAQHISVDSIEALSPELRAHECMVFRLGSPSGEQNTRFALAKVQEGWSDYFLLDQEIFPGDKGQEFLPPHPARKLEIFRLLKLTETSLVNLAVASGLLSSALGLQADENLSIPATGAGTYSFKIKPFRDAPCTWQHNKGQVQIDALVVGRRAGKDTLLVVEAKKSKAFSSLAKHKLVYPVVAISAKLPVDLLIVPVYLRFICVKNAIHFHIAECELLQPKDAVIGVSELIIKRTSHFVLPGWGNV